MSVIVWALFFVLTSPVTGLDRTTLLNKYESEEQCEKSKVKVTEGMEATYPNDTSFKLVCRDITPSRYTSYHELLLTWADEQRPGERYTISVRRVAEFYTPENDGAIAIGVTIRYKDGKQDYMVMFSGGDVVKVLGAVEMQFADEEDEDNEGEGVFSGKDQA
jgi:hypothetical protein